MGGLGSGNWHPREGAKKTTERQNRIDIRWLRKQGVLKPSNAGSLSWYCGDEITGSIHYRMETNQTVLSYRYLKLGGEWETIDQFIPLDQSPCHYGGYRLWFKCPSCNRRVAVLYGAGKYFCCRTCYNLTYSSQNEGEIDRLLRKARKIRARLGASQDLTWPILDKPKNMHWSTFERLRAEADCLTGLSWKIFEGQNNNRSKGYRKFWGGSWA